MEAETQWLKEGVLKERKNGGRQVTADDSVEFGHKKRATDWAGRGCGIQQSLLKMGGY